MPEASATRNAWLAVGLRKVGWFVAAALLLAAWTVAFLFLLMMASDRIAPVNGPEQTPEWLAYLLLGIYAFAWPLLLLTATRRLVELNRALRQVLIFLAAITFIGAVSASIGFGDVVGPGKIVLRGTTLDSATSAYAKSFLTALAVLVAGRPNKGIEQNARR